MQESLRAPLLVSCLLVASLLSVMFSPIMSQTSSLEDSIEHSGSGESSVWTISPTTGTHTGGTNLTLTTTGLTSYFEESNWENFTIDSSADVGQYSSIGVDSNNEIHMSYYDVSSGNLKYASNSGGSWSNYPIDTTASIVGKYTSLDIDSNDNVHISYGDLNAWNLKYATNVAGSWSRSIIDNGGSNGQAGMYSSLEIDSNDLIHVSYWARNMDLKYAAKSASGGAWSDEVVDWGTITGEWTSIGLDSNQKPFIAFIDETYDRLEIAYKSGSSWTASTVDSGSSGEIDYGSSIAIDSNDAKHIVYYDDDNGDLKYADFNTQSNLWQYTALDSTGDVGKYPSLEIDSQDNLHVAYYDNGNQELKYAHHNGTSWEISTLDESGGMHPSLTIDSNDNIYISYYDDTNSNLKMIQKIVNSNAPLGEVQVEFVGYGNVTGTVLDDETITFSSPPGNIDGEVVDLAIWLENGTKINLPVSFEYETYDSDGDGIPNISDDCPQTYGDSTIDQTGCPDSDGDGYSNSGDDFPNDSSQYSDYDNDGCGDNPTGVNADEFPYDTTQCTDSDSDGYGDNLSGNNPDNFPSDSSQWNDTDGDGFGDNPLGNNSDYCPSEAGNSTMPGLGCLDSDGDGYANTFDAFPFDASETHDTDSDGVGDNSDAFPVNNMEQFDADGDGVGDNADAFPMDANETLDTDGDGVGDNADVFPYNAIEAFDSDGDGVGDNTDAFPNDGNETIDSDGDGVGDNADIFPNDGNESIDSDGDGIGDNADQFPFTNNMVDSDGDGYLDSEDEFSDEPTQWNDTDGDGYGDNWGNSDWNESRMSEGVGVFIEGALLSDYCPEVNGNSTDDGYVGCLDADGNGLADIFEQNETNQTNGTVADIDSDGDGVLDTDDACPGTTAGTQVDNLGCKVVDTQNDESDSVIDSFMSGSSGTITKTVGIGAIMIALFSLLQTNLVAAILPDAFRWVQVLRKKSKLSTEEVNELTYLQSLVQAYYNNPSELYEELEDMKFDLTARYTNNEVKKETREKLVTLIDELQKSNADQLKRIAHTESYFGLTGTIDTKQRTELLEEKVAMSDTPQSLEPVYHDSQQLQEVGVNAPPVDVTGVVKGDGYEWYEWPEASGSWWYRTAYTQDQWQYYRQ